MLVVRILGRGVAIVGGLVLLAFGAAALGIAYLPENAIARAAGRVAIGIGAALLGALGASGEPRELMLSIQTSLAMRFIAAPAGLIAFIAALLPGSPRASASEIAAGGTLSPEADAGVARKARKHAAALAKREGALAAAEYCFDAGLMAEAAEYFIQAEQWVRAAEIRHDQGSFIESAELFMKGGRFDAAGRIFAQQEENGRAGDAYFRAGNLGIAAELFEKAGEWLKAAEAYDKTGYSRQAAQAYVKCGKWEKAAICLEQTIVEEATGGRSDGVRSASVQKLVRMAANLFERAGLEDRAEAVLVRGECFSAAAEIALRRGRDEGAVELFLRGKDAPRAAEVMTKLGQTQEAARVLADHHRDIGDHEEAARCFAQAGELLTAGDIYRMLEKYAQAGECYEQSGDAAQAAEMFALAGDRARAATSYEQAGLFAEAAECASDSGDDERQAELLAQAGKYLRASEILLKAERIDAAIAVLQQVPPGHAELAAASARLGEIFYKRGKPTLAIVKLRQATDGREISAGNAQAFYVLALALEANGDLADADALYERILSFDYSYKDVQQRLERTRASLKKRAEESRAAESRPLTRTAEQGRYKIIGKLGKGGMGIVYKATDTVLDRTVAFKVLPDALKENPQALKNFLREAKSAAKLNHPGIVTVYDAGEQDGVYYIAMEYVDGNTLKDIIKHRGKISPGGIIHVLTQMCDALAYAHEQKVVHRDIKTANTMWTRDRKAKIMDFGLARAIEEVRNHTTVVSGTPYYMSPEQTLGKNVDHRTDIYSLGVSVFELATGTLPFREGNLPYHHVHTPPPDPREFNAELPPLLVKIIARCLEKDPANRYQSALDISKELKAGLEGAAARS
ncbi:MAG TPA: protein kinase [Myxococcota bacterium]|nr:protein kinase [Myxococcota bacterium]